jgi:hypothetical protein
VAAVGVGAYAVTRTGDTSRGSAAADASTTTLPPETTTTTKPPYTGWVDPVSAFQPYYEATTIGLLTFRGNPTRTYYGQGPIPAAPHTVWQYPGSARRETPQTVPCTWFSSRRGFRRP